MRTVPDIPPAGAAAPSPQSAWSPPPALVPWLFPAGEAPARAAPPAPARDAEGPLRAVLFDRDGTLVEDVPYNGAPERVRPVPGVRAALDMLRGRGIAIGVVSNQSGIARGLVSRERLTAVQRRVEELLGPFAVWAVCPHGPEEGCGCRKPAPGLVHAACARLGVRPEHTVVIGDIGADVRAARAAGARGVLVPTPVTLPREIAEAPETAPTVHAAVRALLREHDHDRSAGARRGPARPGQRPVPDRPRGPDRGACGETEGHR
ncbi:HAD-IIIA family hydrolase [Streptomyces sp. YIM 98790]|uniref:D-glycero-alpha-D-manno-heptose-1,7-bisphosphate 7-phosphatase n=1 Tax=Streptomyces sp. YIM 98790 TaxID=2689077 RepID=UPI00140E27AD|nr:HAD-IIIA family hydrolase [Streptomyces sp. YIM 98790]